MAVKWRNPMSIQEVCQLNKAIQYFHDGTCWIYNQVGTFTCGVKWLERAH